MTAQEDLPTALAALRPEISDMLREDLPGDLLQAQQAFDRGDWVALQDHVHRVNGSASFCHLWALKALCTRIEDGLKHQQPPAQALMRDYAAEIARVMQALESQTG